jgi:fumarate reductase subunit D
MARSNKAARNHTSYWASIGHRLSGLALAAFIPVHFYVLSLAANDTGALDGFLALADQPLFKIGEWGLVVLLVIHMSFGIRVLILEFLPWRHGKDGRTNLVWVGCIAALIIGVYFLVRAV